MSKTTKEMTKKKEKDAIQLGWKVRDIVSGIVGIAIARIEYLNGCIQFCVVPPFTPGAVEVSSFYIDDVQLLKVDDGVLTKPSDTSLSEPSRRYGANIQPPAYGSQR